MPDKRIDEQMVDRAWEQMQALLDKEMPTQRKRRRAAVIWLPLLGAAAATGLIWLYFFNPLLPRQEKTSTPTATIDNNASEGSDPSHKNQGADRTAKSTGQAILIAPDQKISASKKNNPPPNAQSFQHFTKNTSDTPPIAALDIQQPLVPAVAAETTTALAANPMMTIAQKKFSIAYKTEYSLDPTMLPLPRIISSDKMATFRLEAEAGLQAGNFAAIEGYSGGMALSYPTQNEKWTLRSGMTFSAQRRFILPGDMTQVVLENNTTNNAGQGAVNAGANINNRTLNFQLYQLSVPVVASAKLGSRFALEGGVQTAYLLSATNLKGLSPETRNGFSAAAAEPLDKLYADLSASENAKKIDITALNRWELSLLAGASYQIHDHWTLRFLYQQGVKDIIKNTDFQSFNSNFNLSAIYYFKQK